VSETVSKPVEVGVVLQGGGALGAYECGALLELINYLAVKIAPDEIDAIVNIDMQDPAVTLIPAAQNPPDDKDGMRDFSPETVRDWHRDGFRFAHDILQPAFENRWHALDAQPPEAATTPGS
jgi:hypothetical protein